MTLTQAVSIFLMAAAPALLLGAWAGSGFPTRAPPEPAALTAADGPTECAARPDIQVLRAEVDALEDQLLREEP